MAYIPNELSGPGQNSFFYDNDKLIYVFHCHTDYDNLGENGRMCYCEAQFVDGVLKILYKYVASLGVIAINQNCAQYFFETIDFGYGL